MNYTLEGIERAILVGTLDKLTEALLGATAMLATKPRYLVVARDEKLTYHRHLGTTFAAADHVFSAVKLGYNATVRVEFSVEYSEDAAHDYCPIVFRLDALTPEWKHPFSEVTE